MSESGSKYIYVCDKCGDLVTIADVPLAEDVPWECGECHGNRFWEFTDEQNAREHSEYIRRGLASGLFRRV